MERLAIDGVALSASFDAMGRLLIGEAASPGRAANLQCWDTRVEPPKRIGIDLNAVIVSGVSIRPRL